MSRPNAAAIKAAADALASDGDATQMFNQMIGVIELVERGTPVQLTGRPGILNPLIELYGEDQSTFERVMTLINRTRSEAGLLSLDTPESGDDDTGDTPDRRAYMREFMAQKREKQAILVRSWNELLSDRDRLRGTKRMEFERIHAARLGRRLSETERKEVATRLRSDVQDELDSLAEFAQDQIRKPLHLRSATGFQFKVGNIKRGS